MCGAGNLEATWVLALGIAIQDFPEGDFCFNSFVKLGSNKPKSVLLGWLSEIVEPLGALLSALAVQVFQLFYLSL